MSNSVRSRLDREREQQERQAAPSPASPEKLLKTNQLVVGNPTSRTTRSRAEEAAMGTETEEFIRPDPSRSQPGLTAHIEYVGNTRQRIERKEFDARYQAEAPTTSSADYYYDEYKRKEAEKKQREAEDERKRQERVARQKAIQEQNAKNFVINLAFTSAGATPAEIKRVTGLLANIPVEQRTLEKVASMVWQIRDISSFSKQVSESDALSSIAKLPRKAS